MGRNIWQSDYPVPMIKAVRSIVHGHATVDQAYDLFKSLSKESPSPKISKPSASSKQKPSKPTKKRKTKK